MAYSNTTCDYVWSTWTTDATTAGPNYVWQQWVSYGWDSSTTSTASIKYRYLHDTQQTVWVDWVNEYSYDDRKVKAVHTPKTLEQRRAERAQAELTRVWSDLRLFEAEEEKRAAEVTARELLKNLISEKEMKIYQETGRLLVRGRYSDFILNGHAGGVVRVEKDKVYDLCVHLREHYKYPPTDNLIALKLAIESNEEEFNRTANVRNSVGEGASDRHRDFIRRVA